MSLKLAAGLSIVCASSLSAAAERSIVVEVTDPAPFAAIELAAAMRMRLPVDGVPVRVRVSPTADGVRVDTAPGTRDVSLQGLRGAAAARLVALAVSDLLLDDLAAVPELVARASEGRAPRTLGFAGSVASWDGVLGTGSFDLSIRPGSYVGSLELGAGTVVGGPVQLIAATARIDGGVRVSVFELRGGLTLAPILVPTGTGDLTALIGGNASLRIRIPVTRGSRAVLAVGADAFVTRTQYILDGTKVTTTPRVAPWLAAGMELAL